MTAHVDEHKVYKLIPHADIAESKDAFIVRLDIPGAEKDTIKASIEKNILTVIATTAPYFSVGEKNQFAKEYRREFSLGDDIQTDNVSAQYNAGIVTITLNKKQQYQSKQIIIN